MLLTPAVASEYAEIVALANMAYRGARGTKPGWNVEAGVVEGPRLELVQLRDDLAAKPQAMLLVYREEADDPIQGTVWLEPKADGAWYLGLLTIHPELQNQQLGSRLLEAAEAWAKERGGTRIRMTVLNAREALLAWYGRRGYVAAGETERFPYGDERFGRPIRDDLYFVVLEKQLADAFAAQRP